MWALVVDLCANFDPFFPENSFDKEIASFPIYIYIYIFLNILNGKIQFCVSIINLFRVQLLSSDRDKVFKPNKTFSENKLKRYEAEKR